MLQAKTAQEVIDRLNSINQPHEALDMLLTDAILIAKCPWSSEVVTAYLAARLRLEQAIADKSGAHNPESSSARDLARITNYVPLFSKKRIVLNEK